MREELALQRQTLDAFKTRYVDDAETAVNRSAVNLTAAVVNTSRAIETYSLNVSDYVFSNSELERILF